MRKIMKYVLLSLAMAMTGCVSAAFRSLPAQEHQTFFKCRDHVMKGRDLVVQHVEFNPNEYADIKSPRERRKWLLRQGCPPSIANPDRYLD